MSGVWQSNDTGRVHDFRKSLARSQELARAPWWEEIYRRAFPSFKSMEISPSGSEAQRELIDRKILLDNGHSFHVEEKVREEDWPDFLLEFWSSEEDRRPGWIAKDGHADFLAYVFLPSRRCWLLPWPLLRLAWRTHHKEWCRLHRIIRATNEGYTTVSCAVPIPTVIDAIKDAWGIPWGERQLVSCPIAIQGTLPEIDR